MAKRNVYTYWNSDPFPEPAQAEMLRLWALSWSARGWRPKILTAANAARHKSFQQFKDDPREFSRLAMEAVKAPQMFGIRAINFSGRPGTSLTTRRYGFPGWKTADIVTFDNPEDVLTCGRPL